MTQEDWRRASLPPEGTRVVQFHADTGLDITHMAGCVEHVISGQAGHFHLLVSVVDFITRVLAEGEAAGAAEKRD